MLYPFVMEPFYKDYIWGGRNLKRFGKRLPEGNVAESWEVSARSDGESRIGNGCFAGMGLSKAVGLYPRYILGDAVTAETGGLFPLLFKLIDARDTLSVQVHPGDAYAQTAENEPNGKHEAWYILDAAPDAKIVYGLKPGTDSVRLKQMILENRIAECLNTVRVQPGDVIDIAPGTVHAIGKGIVLAEIQQNSDLTYRLYDHGRKDAAGIPRALHTDKALDVIDYAPPAPFPAGETTLWPGGTVTRMLCNSFFYLDVLRINGTLEMPAQAGRFSILFVAQGAPRIAYDGGVLRANTGASIVIPAALGRYAVSGECSALGMSVPAKQPG